jgi:formyl-CoA transferase
MGNDNVTASPSGTFRTGDGLINIAANKQEQFEELCRVVGRPEWISHPHFADRHARLQHRAELKGLLEEALSERSTEDWWQRLNAAGVPAGPVYTVPQALQHEQIASRGMVATYRDVPGVGRDVRIVRTGFKVDGRAPEVDSPPPQLGQHTDAILAELGFDAPTIQSLKQQKAV